MDIRELLRHPIAFYPRLIQLTGSATTALFLSQCIYWTDRTSNKEGWFWKSRNEWQTELNLKFSSQLRARTVLTFLKILEEKYNHHTQIISFRFNVDRLCYLLQHDYCCKKIGQKIISFDSPLKPSILYKV